MKQILFGTLGAVVLAGTLSVTSLNTEANTVPNPMAIPNPMGIPNPMAPTQSNAANPTESEYETSAEFGGLPVSEGVDTTYYLCTACHSVQTFAQLRVTDERWEYLWDWMIKEQGMADYGEENKEIILSYVKRHFSSER